MAEKDMEKGVAQKDLAETDAAVEALEEKDAVEKDILDVARDVVADGSLDEQGVETILAAARQQSESQPLTTKERSEIMGIVRNRTKGITFERLPMPLRILSILLIATGALGVAAGVIALFPLFDSGFMERMLSKITTTTAVVIAIAAVCSFVSAIIFKSS